MQDLKASKCHFVQPRVSYLGYIVSAEGVEPDPAKMAVFRVGQLLLSFCPGLF